MPLRSVLEIDVNAASFQQFHALFQRYQAAVQALPQQWRHVNQAIQPHEHLLKGILAGLAAQTDYLQHAIAAQKQLGTATQGTATHMARLTGHMRTFAHNAREATRDLLKWSTVVEAVGGLLGAGGLWGISRLAQSATGGFRGATGLGTTWGGMGAFNAAFGRFSASPASILGGVMTGMTDPSSPQFRALSILGLSQRQMAGMDTADAAVTVMSRLGEWARRQNPQTVGLVAERLGLTSIAPLADILNARDRPEELAEARRNYAELKRETELRRGNLKLWADLNTMLDAAKFKIETALVQGLTALTKPLAHLSSAFSDAVSAFLKSPVVGHWIDIAADALEHFAKYIASDSFRSDVENLAKGIGEFAAAVWKAVKFVADIFERWTGTEPTPGGARGAMITPWWWGGQEVGAPRGGYDFPQWWKPPREHAGVGLTAPTSFSLTAPERDALLRSVSAGEAGPQLYKSLSGGGSFEGMPVDETGYPIGWTKGAGRYQFIPSTWHEEARRLGLHRFDQMSQDMAAWDLATRTYMEKTHRDLAADLRAGGHESDISQALRGQWLGIGPRFVDDLRRILGDASGQQQQPTGAQQPTTRRHASAQYSAAPTVRVVVDNRTGGQIAVLNNMLTASA